MRHAARVVEKLGAELRASRASEVRQQIDKLVEPLDSPTPRVAGFLEPTSTLGELVRASLADRCEHGDLKDIADR